MNSQLQHHRAETTFIKKRFPIVLVCDAVNSPANIGSLFRIADSFGIEKIYFCGEDITIISKRMQRTARSTHEYIAYEQADTITEVIDTLLEQAYTILSLEITENSIPVQTCSIQKNQKIALVIGEENMGVSPSVLNISDSSIHINMYGNNSSMNVATATAIALHEITKKLMPEK
ncbi:TrmH family RNA methyltransferase [Aquimarina hainanensis]|uniref:TrmH family RNA methyltransferase n=1 Tax=Aquimarina hainanensis TaxID=1578017 RepID=A0ABW5NAL3_9FLAO|nr:TrmH family RNA methyltransferase [Aquimarina sp. TRL1]QKX07012.1 TrmH family RNA methyltransferase [Aquimarina sp. TRL1]